MENIQQKERHLEKIRLTTVNSVAAGGSTSKQEDKQATDDVCYERVYDRKKPHTQKIISKESLGRQGAD